LPQIDQSLMMIAMTRKATQYCDGLRGPIVVHDPYDPFSEMYDVDDGAYSYIVYLGRAASLKL
jgi:hypothetical protein